MLKWVKLLLLVALPTLAMTPAIAGDYDGPTENVQVNVLKVERNLDGKIVTSFGLIANEWQVCVYIVKPPQVRRRCEQPTMGLCYEIES